MTDRPEDHEDDLGKLTVSQLLKKLKTGQLVAVIATVVAVVGAAGKIGWELQRTSNPCGSPCPSPAEIENACGDRPWLTAEKTDACIYLARQLNLCGKRALEAEVEEIACRHGSDRACRMYQDNPEAARRPTSLADGGVTANQLQRHLDDSKRVFFRERISKDKLIKVSAASGDRESLIYAQEIYDWLRKEGYRTEDGVNFNTPETRFGEFVKVVGDVIEIEIAFIEQRRSGSGAPTGAGP
jgi:hypothetical protein